ncbi:MAG: UDP-N-acetylmuramate--L-alanine ligase [Candidatus Falkowbacteria bacterium]
MNIKGKNIETAYFIGVKGVGMTMLAQFLVESGVKVSGSDNPENFMTTKVLQKEKIKIMSPFAVKNIPSKVDLIVYSSAFNVENNVELSQLLDKKNKKSDQLILVYAEALGEIFSQFDGLAVCGSHGKTTTSAWLGYVLYKGGLSPNVLVGAPVPQFKGSTLKGRSRYFVAETDEYQNKLQYFSPKGVLLNNIDYDHPDFFKTEKDYIKVFADFVKKVLKEGFLVVNVDDKAALKISKECPGQVISYALKNKEADYLASDLSIKNGRQYFSVTEKGKDLGRWSILLSGEHNVYNALAVIAAAKKLGMNFFDIKKAVLSFSGTERRLQILGKYQGALIIDDYAHHPTEIKSTLEGVRKMYMDRNIITVFHPHTFTRTKALLDDFSKSFNDTNELVLLDIYGSAREKQGGVSSLDLLKKIKKHSPNLEINYIPTLEKVTEYLKGKATKNDLILLMGAGDVFRVGKELIKK